MSRSGSTDANPIRLFLGTFGRSKEKKWKKWKIRAKPSNILFCTHFDALNMFMNEVDKPWRKKMSELLHVRDKKTLFGNRHRRKKNSEVFQCAFCQRWENRELAEKTTYHLQSMLGLPELQIETVYHVERTVVPIQNDSFDQPKFCICIPLESIWIQPRLAIAWSSRNLSKDPDLVPTHRGKQSKQHTDCKY